VHVPADDERIALLLDYENLAIGAREGGARFDLKPVTDALAERGRTVVRRAYADWSQFAEDRRMLARHNVELIEIPQRLGAVRKNAADIKLAVDAIELSLEREYITTFAICSGDSDFTPLVQKLRELNKRVIGIGLQGSTSALLPPACDEFLFYDGLEGVEAPRARARPAPEPAPVAERPAEEAARPAEGTAAELRALVAQTLAGLKRSSEGAVTASQLKRTILRKDPTFSEADYGFRGFGELLAHLQRQRAVELVEGPAKGDPEVDFPAAGSGEQQAFELLRSVVTKVEAEGRRALLTGLKTELRKRRPGFNERELGFGAFLQFCRAARARGVIEMAWDDAAGDYVLTTTAAASSGAR
jgi:uncharacterized protein (TIGR00288 family)